MAFVRERDARRRTTRSRRWLVVGIVLTAFGLLLTHVPGDPEVVASARGTESEGRRATQSKGFDGGMGARRPALASRGRGLLSSLTAGAPGARAGHAQ